MVITFPRLKIQHSQREHARTSLLKIFFTLLASFSLISCQAELAKDMDLESVNLNLLSIQYSSSVKKALTPLPLLEEANYIISQSTNATVNLIKSPDNTSYEAIIINHQIPDDDSISGYKYIFTFERNKSDFWIATNAQESWAC